MEWVDDFDGPPGAPPGPWWVPELGRGRWGDDRQLQWYTGRPQNAALDGRGNLVVTARREPDDVADGPPRGTVTSARLVTLGHVHVRCGRVEVRLRVPGGLGTWPAFWLLGTDRPRVGWPACGEIDVVEHVGSQPSVVHGTVHVPGHAGLALPDNPRPGLGAAHDTRTDLSAAFHDYAVVWEPDHITWLFDGRAWGSLHRTDVLSGSWPLDRPMHLVLNLAVGGSWPGNETDAPVLPAELVVDRVRVESDDLVVPRP